MVDVADEFAYAKEQLANQLQANPNLTTFKIAKKDHVPQLEHSFICKKNAAGGFELFRMSADILGKGQEGKVKLIENEAGEKFVVKISAAPTEALKTKAQEELDMMEDVGLLLGQFTREREVKRDKVLNKEIGNKLYTLQRYIPGKELAELVKPGAKPLSEMDKLKILREIFACADFVHGKSIIHRDIKPENMIISFDSNGNVQDCTFIDYGVSVKSGETGEVTKPYSGSPRFMAPEIGRNEFSKEFGAYNQLAAKIAGIKSKNPDDPTLPELARQADEQKEKFMAVLKKQYTFTPKTDIYGIGIIARDILKINLDALSLGDLLSADPKDRPTAKEAMTKVQAQINVLIAEDLVNSFDIRKEKAKTSQASEEVLPEGPSAGVTPNKARVPAMVRARDLHQVNGKSIAAEATQMEKLQQFQKRGLKGFFEIANKEFLIDDLGKAYAVYRPLGKGGLGSVYLVQDLESEKWYAAKTSGDKMGRRGESPQVVSVMRHENEMLAELGQLVGVISAFQGQSSAKAVQHAVSIQEFAYGEEYFDIEKENAAIPGDQAVLMALRLFEELADLHSQNILHLDIKPENMKWDPEYSRCKILDMGCSVKVPAGGPLQHEAFHIIGTINYLPPEIKHGKENIFSDKGDVFAAGKSIKAIIDKATNLTELERAALTQFVERTQAADPEDRPTASEAKDILFKVAQQMHNEKRLTDPNVAIQTTAVELNGYITTKSLDEPNKDAVRKGLITWMKSSTDDLNKADKVNIAKAVVDLIEEKYANGTPSTLKQDDVLEMANGIMQGRLDNAVNPDLEVEAILQKSCKALSESFASHLDQDKTSRVEMNRGS